jgi:ribosomal protein L18
MLEKVLKRQKRKLRVKASISNSLKLRLSVYRSNAFIYAQVIDLEGKVICATSDLKIK